MTEQEVSQTPVEEEAPGSRISAHGPRPSWEFLAWGSFVTAASCAVAVVIVILIYDVDALSTVALALAVLAFTAQLIITLMQNHQTSEINADTRSSLAGIRATTHSLFTIQSRHFERVLDAALGKSFRAAHQEAQARAESVEDEDVDPQTVVDETLQRFATRLDEELRKATQNSVSGVTYVPPTPALPSVERDPAILDALRTFPRDDEGLPVYEELKTLRVRSVAALGKIASQVQRHPRADRTVRFARSKEGPNPDFLRLIDEGYLENLPERATETGATLRITDKGFTALRLIAAKGEQPEWMNT